MFTSYSKKVWYFLTAPDEKISSVEDTRRARLLSALLIPLILISAFGGFFAPMPTETENLSVQALSLVSTISYIFSRTVYFKIGGILAIIALYIPPYIELYNTQVFTIYAVVYLSSWMTIPVLLGSLWLPLRAVILIWLCNMVFFSSLPLQIPALEINLIIVPLLQLFLIGSIILLAASIRNKDLKKLIQQSAELSDAKDKAESALETKSMFLATMSHEIRTPMNGVIGILSLLNLTELNPKQKEYAKIATSSAESLLNILNDILDFSKVEAGKLTLEQIDIDISDLVEEVVALYSSQTQQKNIELFCHVPAGIATLHKADPTRLRQILSNLISNAIKFTNEGEISVSLKLAQDNIVSQDLLFEIKDSGVGINATKTAHIFDSFTQADGSMTRKYGGTGLGLTISKHLVEKMGGSIGVNSIEGQGSVFWFKIPFKVASHADTKTPHHLPRRVLVVDDNDTNLKIISSYLSSWDIRHDCIAEPEQTLSKLQDSDEKGMPFELILLDMSMPKLDGVDLAEIINNSSYSHIPVMLLTSTGMIDKRIEAANFKYIIAKPIRKSVLYNALIGLNNTAQIATEKSEVQSPIQHEAAKAHVLLVEDHLVNQMVADAMLAEHGFDADIASNGQEAVEKFKHNSYEMIFMDCQMPIMNGFEATQAIRNIEQSTTATRTPIIALTANALEGDRDKCIDSGMDDYIPKPFTTSDLVTVLERWHKNDNQK